MGSSAQVDDRNSGRRGTAGYQFGPYRLYPAEHRLTRDHVPIALAPKAFEILLVLVQADGHLLTREQLMQRVWPDSFVEETNLTVNISLLRKLLADTPDGSPYIETVPRKGYRFQAGVVAPCSEADGLSARQRPAEPPQQEEVAVGTPAPVEIDPPAAQAGFTGMPAEPRPGLGALPASSRFGSRLPLLLAGLLAIAAIGLYSWRVHYAGERSSVQAGVSVLAVLPFHPLNARPEDEYLGLGMADALITRLGALRHVVVRPIGTVRRYDAAEDPLAAARKLAADDVLEGTVQSEKDRTRVTVRLLHAASGETLWSATLDEKQGDVFALEDSISQQVASALAVTLSGTEKQRLAQPSTVSSEAYQDYLRGRFYWNKRTADGVRQSIEAFQQAIRLDPHYALAYAGIADAYILAGSYGYSILPPREAMPKARDAANQALSFDESLAEAHTSLAYIRFTYDWDWDGAEREFRRAIALNPGYDTAHHWYSHELIALGRSQEALAEARIALSISPTDVVMNEHMGWTHMMMRDYPAAIEACQKALTIDPGFLLAHRVLGLSYLYIGQPGQAVAEFERGVALSHGDPVAQAYLARAYAVGRQADAAQKLLAGLEKNAAQEYVPPMDLAAAETSLGHTDVALGWLATAYTERSAPLAYLKVDRTYDPLRKEPRFEELVRRLKL